MSERNSKRSSRIIEPNEARVLKEMRVSSGLSMKKAGLLIGISDSYVAHVETGHVDPPKSERLVQFLSTYGGIKEKSFNERVRNHQIKVTPKSELLKIIERLDDERVYALLFSARNMLNQK